MLSRWDTRHTNIKYFLATVMTLCHEILKAKTKGRPTKHSKEYAALIAIKEEKKASLRKADTDFSEEISLERVDHSVIHYWEKKLYEVFTALVKKISQLLVTLLTPLFNIIDSTKFVTWNKKEVEFHTQTLITKETVFPVKRFFGSVSPGKATKNTIIKGKGNFMADA
jgi:hypothetical protein